MGLFGLFATMFGLGAMTKDGIERGISSSNAYNKAISNKDDWYFTGNGSEMRSVKTGRKCYIQRDIKTGHVLLKDLDTDKLIVDQTAEKVKKEEAEKRSKLPNQCVFYHMPEERPNVYISDRLPGYYKHSNPDDRFDGVNENSLFFKANLTKSINRKYQHDIWECRPLEAYLMDGTKWTIDRAIKQENENRYNNAIKKGDKFWQKVVDGNFAFCHLAAVKTEPYYRSVDTDEYYIYNWRKEYFIKAKKDTVKENIAQPHHEPEYVFKEVWVEDDSCPKLNLDGSKWYE